MIEIGEDLVDEILVRQPAKSLMRFKCVCKRWNDLFRKPTFANRNMKLHDKKKYVLTREVYAPPLFMISENDGEVLELQHPTPDDDNPAWIMEMHVYNGVLLFRSIVSGKLFFWNPITGEIKYIIPPPFHEPSFIHNEGVKIINGFGGDPNTIDFKHFSAVSIVEPTHESYHFGMIADVTYPHISFQLYSLSTDSWTPLDLVMPVTFDSVLGDSADLFFNGVLHWLYNEGGDESEKGILCFHFSNNQFTTLPLPPYNTTLDFPPNHFNFTNCEILYQINDSLAYVQHMNHYTPLNDLGHMSVHSFINIWTLDQDTYCWTKKYKFEQSEDSYGNVIGFWKNPPELFGSYRIIINNLDIELYLALYNPDGHLIHRFEQIPLHDRTRPTLIHKYVQSIAPLSFS